MEQEHPETEVPGSIVAEMEVKEKKEKKVRMGFGKIRCKLHSSRGNK